MLDDSHPLTLELDSLRSAVARFQDEAHNASVRLQRFSFDTANTQDRIALLERENEVLRHELSTLRANPHPDSVPESHPAVQRSQELTLTLRKLSDKISLTEEALQTRTTELVHATSEATKSKAATEAAYALAAQIRGREEEGKVRERDLERQVMEAKEETRMSDLVVKEYADLVRSLEGRGSTASAGSGSLVDGLSEGKSGLQRLFNDFSSETEKLQSEVTRLRGQLAESESRLEGERKGAEADRILLAQIQHQLEKLKLDDRTAAKMVSRYMKFSQTATDTLQVSLNTLKTRHSTTIDTLTSQITDLSRQLQTSEATSDKLRTTLDELGKDIMRESFGRRREIALRLRLVTREQVLNDGLERLARRVSEASERHQSEDLTKVLEESQALLTNVNGTEDVTGEMGSLARILAAESAVRGLIEELKAEKERRLYLETGRTDLIQQNEYANGHVNGLNVREKTLPTTPLTPEYQGPVADSPAESPASAPPPAVILPSEIEERPPSPSPENLPDSSTSSEVTAHALGSEGESDCQLSPPALETSLSTITQSNGDVTDRERVSPSSSPPPSGVVIDDSSPVEDLPDHPKIAASSPTVLPSTNLLTSSPLSSEPLPSLNLSVPSPSTSDTNLEPDTPPHPLLAELALVGKRYDDLSRALRDCHLALQELKKHDSGSNVFNTAIDRLDDFTEDARVELEIRAADEALLAQGYETMLSIPGATRTPTHTRTYSQESIAAIPTLSELETQVQAFTSGLDPAVQKARQNLEQKLADVQHDIAKLKLAIHEQQRPVEGVTPPPELSPPSVSPSTSSSGWTSWLSSSSSRPASPSPAPTFGNVMTTPRLRHASSITRLKQQQLSPSREDDPFSNLGLKIAMPTYKASSFSPNSSASPIQRNRTVSMLGLGGGTRRTSGASPRVFSASPSSGSPGTLSSSISRSTSSSAVTGAGSDEEIE
ncbi:hypothetical protein V5O48_005899 [Marasmius crinis-equi]|uniref:Uncharacterized protein n=1 Tax=Marasmius crinis-equi TaxID=585013 RepID=A0ABR3FL04_9AGAR